MKKICLIIIISVLLLITLNGLQAQNDPKLDQRKSAHSSAETSVRNWYNAFLKLDSTGLFNFWATDHSDFVYATDGAIERKEDFLKRLVYLITNIKTMTKATILEGYPHKISNTAYSYTARAIIEGMFFSGNSFSYNVTATFVLKKINRQWKCIQCSAAHVSNLK
mgnify:CR=1 FL=1